MDILINNLTWHIDFIDDDKIQMNGENGSIFFGKTEYIPQTILIRRELSKEATRTTIIHELTHCYLYSYGMSKVDFNEEFVCDFVGIYADEIIKVTDRVLDVKK